MFCVLHFLCKSHVVHAEDAFADTKSKSKKSKAKDDNLVSEDFVLLFDEPTNRFRAAFRPLPTSLSDSVAKNDVEVSKVSENAIRGGARLFTQGPIFHPGKK